MAVVRGCDAEVVGDPVRGNGRGPDENAADSQTGHFGSASRCLCFTLFFMRTDLGVRTTLMAIGNMVSAGLSRLIQESHVIATVWRDRRK